MAIFSEDVRPITDLKTRAADIVDHVRRSRRPVFLTRRGRGVAVLLDIAEYESLVERARFVATIEEGAADARAGRLHPNEEAMKILDSFGEPDGGS